MACEHELEAPVYLWLPSKVFSHEGFQQQPCWPPLKHCSFNTPITSWLFKVAHWECYVTLAFILTTLLKKKSYKFRNALGQVAHWHFITARVFISGTDSSCHASEAKLTDAFGSFEVVLTLRSLWYASLKSESVSLFICPHWWEQSKSVSRPPFILSLLVNWFCLTGVKSGICSNRIGELTIGSPARQDVYKDDLRWTGYPKLEIQSLQTRTQVRIKCLIQPSWGTQAML